MELTRILFIGLGGFVGANLRYVVQGWAADRLGTALPYGTMIANVRVRVMVTVATWRCITRASVSSSELIAHGTPANIIAGRM